MSSFEIVSWAYDISIHVLLGLVLLLIIAKYAPREEFKSKFAIVFTVIFWPIIFVLGAVFAAWDILRGVR